MKRVLLALCVAAVPGAAMATDWSVEAGAAIANEPDHIGAKSRRWLLLPTLSATYGTRLQASIDDGLRWTAFDLGRLKLGPVVEYRTSFDRGLPRGFPTIRDAIEPGIFAELTTPVAVVEARVRRAVTGYRGWSADLSADTLLPIRIPGTVGLEARVNWADRAFGRSRFGIDGPVALANGLNAYAAHDFLSVGAGAQWRLPLSPHLALTASAGIDRLLTNGSSPVVATRSVIQSGLGLSWSFGSAGFSPTR